MRWLLLVVIAACPASCGGSACLSQRSTEPVDDLGPVGDFRLTERSGRKVTQDDFRGKIWIASFVFTRCTGPCPQVTGTMARLQSELAGKDGVLLVSFTVDPDRDELEDLRAYADHFGADKDRWLFLTGPKSVIDSLSEKGFGLGLQRAAGKDVKPGQEITHSTRLTLVDRHGHKRGYFDGRSVDDDGQPVDDLPRLKEALATLLREQP
ncbi:MAG TPA: SCO family protein [Gemmataceae bacterium]|nr:SCO family protein [Gemmataceae bacterium]